MSTFVNPDKSYEEQANRVYAFYDKVGEIRDRFSMGETDARRVNLNNIMMAANAAVATLRLMSWASTQGEAVMTQALRLSKPEYISFVAEDLLRSSKLFLLLETQFQTETLFKNILRELGSPTTKQGYYNIAESVLLTTGVPDPKDKLKILNVPALMRNSMHANGIHHGWKGSNTVELIDGIEFRFEDGKRVQCGNWIHIITALTATIRIVEEVLASQAVASLKMIPDTYAVELASEQQAPP
jgi:hypothetical protein